MVALAEVTGVDPVKRQLYLDRYPDRPFDYDYMVVAVGVETSYFGHDDWARFAPGMKTLEEAHFALAYSFVQATAENMMLT